MVEPNIDIEKVLVAADFINNRLRRSVSKAVVLGTGLTKAIASFEITDAIHYKEIPHTPVSTVEGHSGSLICCKVNDEYILILSGRFHMYEGYSAKDTTFLIHVLHQLGIKDLIITNAVGGVNPHYHEGDFILIEDHINFFFDNPLRGSNHNALGVRFPDMSQPYSSELADKLYMCAERKNIILKSGIYFGWAGPSLETAAEYKMIYRLGGDVVGMSSLPEVITANYYNMNVAMISVVSNVCFPKGRLRSTTIDDVIKVMNNSAISLGDLIKEVYSRY